MKNKVKILKSILILAICFLFFRYIIIILISWGLIEVIIYSIYKKNYSKLCDFICNFVLTILTSIDILLNIILQVPANRLLLTTHKQSFGDPKKRFSETLKLNFVYNTLKPRGKILYNICKKIKLF